MFIYIYIYIFLYENFFYRKAGSEFNINYHILSHCCKKIPEEDYLHENIAIPTIQIGW